MTAREKIEAAGYEDVMLLEDFSYDDALVGISNDNRAIYDYEKMIEWLVRTQNFTEEEAVEWIDYNTIRALSYYGDKAPIILFCLKGATDERKQTQCKE